MNHQELVEGGSQAAAPRPVTPIGILTEKLHRLSDKAELIPTVDSDFLTELKQATRLAAGLDLYIAECTSPESADLADLADATSQENWQGQFEAGQTEVALEQEMLSGHVEGQFLKLLVASMRAKKVLEIGMFTGYSALAIAEGLPADGRIVACELDPYTAQFARRQFDGSRHGKKIRIEVGAAEETLKKLASEREEFDFVFIDADKPGYLRYFHQLIELNLLASGGLVCVDNTLLQGEPYCEEEASTNGKAVFDFNRCVAEDPRVEQVLIPLRDGITLIRLLDGQENREIKSE